MIRLDDAQLERPAEETARYLALTWLCEAETALTGLDDPGKVEALHDFRVALRRFRSLERAYRPWLQGGVPRKVRRRVRDLVRSTGGGRDAEVHLAWLDRISVRLTRREVAGLERLRERLRADVEGGYRLVAERARPEFLRIRGELTGRLESYELTVSVGRTSPPPSFLAVSGPLVDRYAGELAERVDRVRRASDEDEVHAARIAGKRLRYLLEPLFEAHGTVAECVGRLKEFQDLLGEIHDLHALAPILAQVLEEGAAERARRLHAVALRPEDPEGEASGSIADVTPGILGITRILREERERLFERFEAAWLGDGADAFFQTLRALARRCAAGSGADLEAARTYVLAGLPDRLKEVEAMRLDRGWLPGDRIRERIRRVRSAGTERYYRTVEVGASTGSGGLDERIGRSLWRKLWLLTEGNRVRTKRYEVTEEALHWRFEEFLDFDLVLAEVEFAPGGEEVTIPSWLGPWIVEEVTHEPGYDITVLAHRGAPRRHVSVHQEKT